MLGSIAIGTVVGSLVFIIMSYILLQSRNEISDLRIELKYKTKEYLRYKKLYEQGIDLEEEIENLRTQNIKYRNIIGQLGSENERLKNNVNPSIRHNKDMIKKAARKAMIYSHPDKGGNTDEFIMFKNLYESYK